MNKHLSFSSEREGGGDRRTDRERNKHVHTVIQTSNPYFTALRDINSHHHLYKTAPGGIYSNGGGTCPCPCCWYVDGPCGTWGGVTWVGSPWGGGPWGDGLRDVW